MRSGRQLTWGAGAKAAGVALRFTASRGVVVVVKKSAEAGGGAVPLVRSVDVVVVRVESQAPAVDVHSLRGVDRQGKGVEKDRAIRSEVHRVREFGVAKWVPPSTVEVGGRPETVAMDVVSLSGW